MENFCFAQTYKIDFKSAIFSIIMLLLASFLLFFLNDKREQC